MGGRVLAIVVEVFVGLLLAGIVVGAALPVAGGTIGPIGAAILAGALVAATIVCGEALRRRRSAP